MRQFTIIFLLLLSLKKFSTKIRFNNCKDCSFKSLFFIKFLTTYFNSNLSLGEKLSKLGIKKRRKYYYTYDKLINKVLKEAKENGIL